MFIGHFRQTSLIGRHSKRILMRYEKYINNVNDYNNAVVKKVPKPSRTIFVFRQISAKY